MTRTMLGQGNPPQLLTVAAVTLKSRNESAGDQAFADQEILGHGGGFGFFIADHPRVHRGHLFGRQDRRKRVQRLGDRALASIASWRTTGAT